MARLKDNIEYLLARLGMAVANSLTPGAADSFGAGLGRLAYRVWKSRREIAIDNLSQALGDSLTGEEIEAITKKVFQNVGRTLIEFTRFNKLGPDGLRKIVVLRDMEIIQKVHLAGKGGVFVTAHFGNWEMLGSLATALGYEMNAIAAVQHNPLIDRMVTRLRQATGIKIIPIRASTLRDVFRALKANRFIGIVPDQHDPAEGLVLDFFGRQATVPRGPAVFAIKAGCPILPYMMRRERYDCHVVIPGEPVYPPQSGDMEKDIRDMSLTYLTFFESVIRQYPDQWMWTHRRWKL